MEILVWGTLGLVITAKQRGKITAVRPVLEQLRLSGIYLSDSVIDQALALVEEYKETSLPHFKIFLNKISEGDSLEGGLRQRRSQGA